MNVRTATVVLLIGILAVPAAAQRGPPGGRGAANRMELERNLQRRFDEVVRSRLGLETDRANSLTEVVRSFQPERQALLARQRQLQRRLRVGAGGVPGRLDPRELPEDEAASILQEMVDIRAAEVELMRREQERLLEVLTPAQLVLYYVLREDLAARARRLREGVGGGRGGLIPGGGSFGPAPAG